MSITAAIHTISRRAVALGDRVSWLPTIAMRVAVAATFIRTGWGKLHDLAGLERFFESLGIPLAGVQAPMVAVVELVGGILVLAGLGTRVAALMLAGVMAVALATAIVPQADGAAAVLGSLEFLYLTVFFHLAARGAGPVSLDHLISSRGAIE